MEVHKVFQGKLKKGIVQIIYKGGQVGKKVQNFSHVFSPNIGNTYVLFCVPAEWPVNPGRTATSNSPILRLSTNESGSGVSYLESQKESEVNGLYGMHFSSKKEFYGYLKNERKLPMLVGDTTTPVKAMMTEPLAEKPWFKPKSEWKSTAILRNRQALSKGRNTVANTTGPDLVTNGISGDKGITFSMANESVVNTALNQARYFEFDVVARASTSGAYFDLSQLHFNYNTAVFGSNIETNRKLTLTKGPSITSPNEYLLVANDVSNSQFYVIFTFNGSSPRVLLPTNQDMVLYRVRMEISPSAGCNRNTNLSWGPKQASALYLYTTSPSASFDQAYEHNVVTLGNTVNVTNNCRVKISTVNAPSPLTAGTGTI